MTVAERTLRRGSLLIVLLAASVAWTSCDLASASNTAILNANGPYSLETMPLLYWFLYLRTARKMALAR